MIERVSYISIYGHTVVGTVRHDYLPRRKVGNLDILNMTTLTSSAFKLVLL